MKIHAACSVESSNQDMANPFRSQLMHTNISINDPGKDFKTLLRQESFPCVSCRISCRPYY